MAYKNDTAAARAWMRREKQLGTVTVLGGGWWRIGGWSKPVQGFGGLARTLRRRGILQNLPDGQRRLTEAR